MHKRPLIGLTLDAEAPGGYSRFPWYAIRQNYLDAIADAGGVPVALPHRADLARDYLDAIDGLIVTGGAFDVDPALYGADISHDSVSLKPGRTAAEFALTRGALDRDLPLLGICGGEQLLAVVLGGSLFQHIPADIPDALDHEQAGPRDRPGHAVMIAPGSRLAAIVGTDTMQVNTAHHQAVRDPGPALVVNATAADGVIEGIESPRHRFCLGVQWHPEFRIDPGDGRILSALIEAALIAATS